MDVQALVKKAVAALQGDKNLLAKFTANPVKTLEGILGVDLPDEKINEVIAGVKAKLGDSLPKAGGILNWLKGLFGGK